MLPSLSEQQISRFRQIINHTSKLESIEAKSSMKAFLDLQQATYDEYLKSITRRFPHATAVEVSNIVMTETREQNDRRKRISKFF